MVYIRIENTEYFIGDLKHPGGSVINYMSYKESLAINPNQETPDSKNAFEEFHHRSKKAHLVLKGLPQKQVGPFKKDAMLEDFSKLRESLKVRGFFDTSKTHVFYRFSEIFSMFFASYYLLYHDYYITSTIVASIASGRCGWLMHEAGHNSLTDSVAVNKILQKVLIGTGLWCSGSMWNSMHNKHHATPQKIAHDIDLDTLPLVAFYKGAVENNRRGSYSSEWLKYQAYTYLPLTSGVFVMFFWIYYLHPRKIIRDLDFVQGTLVLSGHCVRTSLISAVTGWNLSTSYLFLTLQMFGSGMYLFGNFALSHTTTPVVAEDEHPTWVHYAFDHTVDINPHNPLINWFMGYLNCQVVHHLFPSMPQFRQPEVSKELGKWAKKWDIKYKVIGYWQAVRECFNNLNEVAMGFSDTL